MPDKSKKVKDSTKASDLVVGSGLFKKAASAIYNRGRQIDAAVEGDDGTQNVERRRNNQSTDSNN
jgi:hypothetical protein